MPSQYQQNKKAVLLAGAFAISHALQGLAGEAATGQKIVIAPQPESHPLCILDGMICFDFEERFRWEVRDNNFDFNNEANVFTDDNWFLQRARLGMKITLTDWLKVYAQAQDAREINSDRPDFPNQLGAEGDDSFDLWQAWVEFGNPKSHPLTLKLGRQILSYGDERLIGAFDWNNIGRTFDAARLRWEEKTWWLDAFAASVAVPERSQFNQSDFVNGTETDRQQIFSGLYFSTTAIPVQTTDFYVLHLHENTGPDYQANLLGDTNFLTLGARFKSKPGVFATHEKEALRKDGKTTGAPTPPKPVGFDYDAEFAFQTGNVRGLDLTACAVHGGIGYTFDAVWLPRLGLAYNYGTGDDDPGDREIQTFQNLFPTNHKFYGQMDVFSWQNMHDLEFSMKVQPMQAVTIKAEYHAFWLETTEDFWYRANGSAASAVRPLNPTARAAGNYAGSEADLTITWSVNKYLQLEAGYSHFFAGDYLADTGPSDDADFGYVQAKLTF